MYAITFLLLSCFHQTSNLEKTSGDYFGQLKNVKHHLKESESEEFGTLLHQYFLDVVFLNWAGTEWDYNGYSNTPKKGYIACGYFVSTSLKHLGFNLNRYDMAKLYSKDIVFSFCGNQSRSIESKEQLKQAIKQIPNGLYILGLSNHVGFLSKTDSATSFIHSDYISGFVTSEVWYDSQAINVSSTYWLGPVSTRKDIQNTYKFRTEIKALKSQ